MFDLSNTTNINAHFEIMFVIAAGAGSIVCATTQGLKQSVRMKPIWVRRFAIAFSFVIGIGIEYGLSPEGQTPKQLFLTYLFGVMLSSLIAAIALGVHNYRRKPEGGNAPEEGQGGRCLRR